MARRVLVIGLGSSGCEVCNQLIERMAWEYGGAGAVKFVDFLGIETDGGGTTTADSANSKPSDVRRLVDTGKMLYVTLSDHDVKSLVESPHMFDADIDLTNWFDVGVLEGKPDVTRGAGNDRMLGRLCLLYPSNLQNAYLRIIRVLSTLNMVPSTVQVACGGGNVTFNMSDGGVSVYVVGTLCGGTASGACIDLGYLLRKIHNESGINLELNGMFAIPPGGWAVGAHNANASAALTELNHYASNWSEYRQKVSLPAERTEIRLSGPPYEFTYLMSPRGLDDRQLDSLWGECAQYIWADAFSEVGPVRKAKQADFVSGMRSPDQFGLNQKFMTFGVSSIEYPATQVIKGCSYRLMASTLSRVLDSNQSEWDLNGDVASKISLDRHEMVDNLWTAEGSLLLNKAIKDCIAKAVKGWGSTDDLRKAETELDTAFGMTRSVKSNSISETVTLKPGQIDETIRQNQPKLQAAIVNKLLFHTKNSLSDPSKGLSYCKALIDAIDAYLESRQKEIEDADDDKFMGDYESKKNHALDQLDVVLGDIITKMVLLEKSAIHHYNNEYRKWAELYYERRLFKMTRPAESAILRDLLQPVKRLRIRLTNLESILRKAVQDAKVTYEDCRDQRPLVNGFCVFEARTDVDKGTVDSQYDLILPDNSAEEKESSLVLQGLDSLLQQVSQPFEQPSDLDIDAAGSRDGGNLPIKFLENLEMLSSRVFSQVRDVSIMDFLRSNSPRTKAILAQAWSSSTLLVSVPDHIVGFRSRATEPRKYYRLIFFRNATNTSQGNGTVDENNVADILRNDVTRDGPGRPGGWGDLQDPSRIIILREYGSIPLRAVPQLSALGDSEATYLTDTAARSRTLRSRTDVNWMPRDVDQMEQYNEILQHLLMGLACGLIKPLPGTAKYKFEERGFSTELPSSIPEAAAALINQPVFRPMVERCVQQMAEQDGEPAIAERIESFINSYLPARWGGISKEDVGWRMQDYLIAHPKLGTVLRTLQNIREEWYQDLHGEDGLYHCRNRDCAQNWVSLADIPKVCQHCGESIV